MAENYAIMPLQDYESACNAIREKTGGTDPITSGDMATQIQGITGGGDTEWMFSGEGFPKNYVYPGKTLRAYAFYNDRSNVGDDYFEEITCPNLESVPERCFSRESKSTASNTDPFRRLSIPVATTIGTYACANSGITDLSAPNVFYVLASAFRDSWLAHLHLPSCSSVANYGVAYGRGLISVDLPEATSIGSYAFSQCEQLSVVDLGKKCSIANSAFSGVATAPNQIHALILRATDAICTLASTNALANSYIGRASDDGYIYVPSALLEVYASATNWSTYASKFRALEDWPKISDWKNWESDPANFSSLTDYLIHYGKEGNR